MLLLLAALLAQAPSLYYEVRYFYAGAAEPFVSYWLVPPEITPWSGVGQYRCGQPRSSSTDTRNPNRIEWNDPDATGRVCAYAEVAGGPLFWFPLGAYEASLKAWTIDAASADSPRAAFVIGDGLRTPNGLQVIR